MTEQIDYELCNANDLENDSMKEFEIKLVDKTYKVLLIKHNNNKFSCVSNKCMKYLYHYIYIMKYMKIHIHIILFHVKVHIMKYLFH